MNRIIEKKLKERRICCDTCSKQIHTHCDNDVYCFNYVNGNITKIINCEKWTGGMSNKYTSWSPKKIFTKIDLLEDELFEI